MARILVDVAALRRHAQEVADERRRARLLQERLEQAAQEPEAALTGADDDLRWCADRMGRLAQALERREGLLEIVADDLASLAARTHDRLARGLAQVRAEE